MSEKIREMKCSYFGAKTDRSRRYGSCECRRCLEAMGGSDSGRCNCVIPSTEKSAFFKKQPDKEYDEFYCGCQSWN